MPSPAPRRSGLAPVLVALVLGLAAAPRSGAQDDPEERSDGKARPLPPAVESQVTVVATRLGAAEPGATVRVIEREEIEHLPVRTLPELLRQLPGVDVRRRGVEGIQADIGLRGADHNGTLLLVDGEPMNDPQTNHLTADIDVPLDSVERVEVLYGASSALWGSGAIGGVVNVVTRGAAIGRKRAELEGRYVHGSHSLDAGAIRTAYRILDTLSASVDWDRGEWSGFRDDTEQWRESLRASVRWDTGRGPVTLSGGWTGREYGAYAFYGTRFPNQQESTRTRTARLAADLSTGGWTLSPSFSLRGHHDDFVLERTDPSFYENVHDTDTLAGRVVARRPLLGGTLAVGLEAGRESISSTNLGDHRRDRGALFLEAGRPFDATRPEAGGARLGLRLDSYEGYGSRVSPLLALHFGVAPSVTVRASAGTAFRVPTFTELYYSDPQNVGNAALDPERAVNVEVGALWARGALSIDAAVFHRDARDLIDYVRDAPSGPFEARNVRRARTTGVEGVVALSPRLRERRPALTRLALQATYLWADLESLSSEAGGAIEGRYVLDPLRYKVDLLADVALPFRAKAGARLSYLSRYAADDTAWLLSARLGVDLIEGEILELYVEGDDLLDERYEEHRGVPSPGRTLAAGARLTW